MFTPVARVFGVAAVCLALGAGCAERRPNVQPPRPPAADDELERLRAERAKIEAETARVTAQIESLRKQLEPPAPKPWFERIPSALSVLSGTLVGAKRVAILVHEGEAHPPSAPPSPYDAILGFRAAESIADPVEEARRLRAALDAIPSEANAAFDAWAEGVAGLVLRHAVEHQAANMQRAMQIVLVDVPNRGLSPAGWPRWDSGGQAPSTALPAALVSGSEFLSKLNSDPATDLQSIEYLVVWRDMRRSVPRASAMGLPRRAIQAVVRVPDAQQLPLSVIDAPVLAVRLSSGSEASVGKTAPEASQGGTLEDAPRVGGGKAPRIVDLLSGMALDSLKGRAGSWLTFEGGAETATRTVRLSQEPTGTPDVLAGLTNPLTVAYVPDTREIVLTGFTDYTRDPLTADIFWAAMQAFRNGYPAVSIDPPAGTTTVRADQGLAQVVRYEGATRGTRLGGLMFEADRVMKVLALGRDNLSGTPITATLPDHESIAAATTLGAGAAGTVWRLWLEPDPWHALEEDPLSARIKTGMRSRWERMTPDYAPSKAVVAFTDHLSAKYRQYASEQPAFDALDQAAALIAAAKWITDARLTVLDAPAPPVASVSTPDRTPIIQVPTNSYSGPWSVVALQGGTVFCSALRHVPDRGSRSRALTTTALASRPPGAKTWRFVNDDAVVQAVAMRGGPATPGVGPGIRNASDKATDPAHTSDACVADSFRILGPLITDVTVDDAADPVEVILEGIGFGSKGLALFNTGQLQTPLWTAQRVLTRFDPKPSEGTLVLRSGGRDSNPVVFRLVPDSERRNPPEISVINRTSVNLNIRITAAMKGSSRDLKVPAGSTAVTRVLPGRYRVSAEAAYEWSIGAATTKEDEYERGRAYTLTYETHTFPLGQFIVQNDTGAPVSVAVTGTQNKTLTVPAGSTTLRLAPGTYTVTAKARCGSRTSTLNVSAGSTDTTRYFCSTVFR